MERSAHKGAALYLLNDIVRFLVDLRGWLENKVVGEGHLSITNVDVATFVLFHIHCRVRAWPSQRTCDGRADPPSNVIKQLRERHDGGIGSPRLV